MQLEIEHEALSKESDQPRGPAVRHRSELASCAERSSR